MSRLFLTGDIHNYIDVNRLSRKNFSIGRNLTKEDCILIAGDFGFPWDGSRSDEYWLDWMEDLPFSIGYCCGNHECFPLLYQYPVEEWHDGLTHVLRPHIHHMMRGEIFNFNNYTFFVFGGARSTDKCYRIEGKSWWPEEIASKEEMENGVNNLEKVNYQVDYILTHCAPNYLVDQLFPYENQHDDMSNYLEKVVRARTAFKRWWLAHYHIDRSYDNQKYNILYNDIVEILPNNEFTVVNNI